MRHIGTCSLVVTNHLVAKQLQLDEDDFKGIELYSELTQDPKQASVIARLFQNSVLEVENLAILDNIPFWFFETPCNADYRLCTDEIQSHNLFRSLLKLGYGSHRTLALLMNVPGDKERSVVAYPRIIRNENDGKKLVVIAVAALNFTSKLALKLESVMKALGQCSDVKADRPIFLEFDEESKKENEFFDKYLRKRSLQRGGGSKKDGKSLTSLLGARQKFADLLERCILSEFQMRSIQRKLTQSEIHELKSLISQSIKFIFRRELRLGKLPKPDKVEDLVTELFQTLMGKDKAIAGL